MKGLGSVAPFAVARLSQTAKLSRVNRALSQLGLLMILPLALGAAGIGLFRLAHNVEGKQRAEMNWPTVSGQLISVVIEPSENVFKPGYRWNAQYSYQVDSIPYSGFRVSGISTSARASLASVQQALRPLIIAPEKGQLDKRLVGEPRWIYHPQNLAVRVSYNPADVHDATVILGPPQSLGGARALGWVFCGGAALVTTLLIWSAAVGAGPKRAPIRRLAPDPNPEAFHQYVHLLDEALNAVEKMRHLHDRPGFLLWQEISSSLQTVRADPARSLRESPRLGFSRWLSEWEYQDGSAEAIGVDQAIGALENFHRAYRQLHLPDEE